MGRSRTGRQGIDSVSDLNSSGDEGDTVRLALGLKDPNRPVKLALSRIRRDGGTQPRAALNQAIIEEYAEAMREGKILPPVIVFHDGQDYWLADGFHRIGGAELNGDPDYPAIVKQGTRRDAILFSCGVNDEHGLRRTNEDKRRAVMTLLGDQEWGTMGSREIAKFCKVSHTYVDSVRRSLATVASEGKQEKIAPEKRMGADGREYRVDRIQKAAQKRAKSPAQSAPRETPTIATPEAIWAAIVAALEQREMVWHELLTYAKQKVTGDIAPDLFNDVLKQLLHNEIVGHSETDQAAFRLATVAESATLEREGEQAGAPFVWAESEACKLHLNLQELLELRNERLEDDFSQLSQKTAEKLRKEMRDVRDLLDKWEEWLE